MLERGAESSTGRAGRAAGFASAASGSRSGSRSSRGSSSSFDAISDWSRSSSALAVVVLYFIVGDRSSSRDTVRQVAWIAAVSQALVVLVPCCSLVIWSGRSR